MPLKLWITDPITDPANNVRPLFVSSFTFIQENAVRLSTPALPTMPNPSGQTLFIFDFDNTLVDDNTDTRPFQHHAPDILETHLQNRELRACTPWTDLVNASLALLNQRGISPSKILQTVSQSPFPSSLTILLKRISATNTTSQAIISDANNHYINVCLTAHGLSITDFTGGVHTNASVVTEDGIVVTPYTDVVGAHACEKCPTNMCKSWIMKTILEEFGDVDVVYVGDGGNDYCPVEKLPPKGLVLARKGYRLEKLLMRTPVKARVRIWDNADELVQIVQEHFPVLR